MRTIDVAALVQRREPLSSKEIHRAIFLLSAPNILSQLTEIAMQYIDTAMVGALGTRASAAISLVAASTWLFGNLLMAAAVGFSIQIAQHIGAGRADQARDIHRQSLLACTGFAIILTGIGLWMTPRLPRWLGADASIQPLAASYFRIFVLSSVPRMLWLLEQNVLQCAGDTRTPGRINVLMCGLDCLFNYFLIFPTRTLGRLTLYGAGLGVEGAALGTALSVVVGMICMLSAAAFRSPASRVIGRGCWKPQKAVLQKACSLAGSIALERAAVNGAQITATRIIAPLGNAAIAAHNFADIVESLCYMPGYGIGTSATTLVGQSWGAGQRGLARRFTWECIYTNMAVMGVLAAILWFCCPAVFAFLTPVHEIQNLGVSALRIELSAEPLFGASIAAIAALRGAGNARKPAHFNLASVWGIRIPLSYVLTKAMGLNGAWLAMCLELNARGLIYIIYLRRGTWLRAS
jgi:putative MATE family efflux protein